MRWTSYDECCVIFLLLKESTHGRHLEIDNHMGMSVYISFSTVFVMWSCQREYQRSENDLPVQREGTVAPKLHIRTL